MKNYLLLILFSAIIMICVPAAMTNKLIPPVTAPVPSSPNSTEHAADINTETETAAQETISVFLTKENTAVDMDMFEYICGSVAAEMPLAYDEEAIKAQAIACYTNAIRMKTNTTEAIGDISDDTSVHQGYINEAQRREKWGDDFELYENKLKEAVRLVQGKALYYDNQLCVAAFFAISSGQTESAKNIWGTDVPYLVPVSSDGDRNAKGYASLLTLNKEDFLTCLKNLDGTSSEITSLKNIITITETSDSGTVLKATVNGKEYSGEKIRAAFGLRSPVFTVTSDEDTLTFSVSGYGHGVGMSQYGADYYAKQGYTYEEILKHYYPNTQIMSANT